jgi:hypothetical protein
VAPANALLHYRTETFISLLNSSLLLTRHLHGANSKIVGRDSSVSITTSYRLDGPGIESQWGDDIFRTRSDRPWGPHSPLYSGCRISFQGVKRPRCGVEHPPTTSAKVKERVELYLFSPSGSSWSVIG